MTTLETHEVVDGQIDVTIPAGRTHRVLVPAGVGLPGVDDATLAALLVEELLERGVTLPQVVDASQVLAREPGLLGAVAARIEHE